MIDTATARPVALVTGRPDVEIAKELKTEFLAKLEELCLMIDKAHDAGFEVSYSTGKRWDGKQVVSLLVIAKHFS